MTNAELPKITAGYTVEFARVLRVSSPDAAFSFLNGSGADPTGGVRPPSLATGEAEKELLARGHEVWTV